MILLDKLIRKIRGIGYYVIADPSDNSITLSKKLFFHMKRHSERVGARGASVFMFRVRESGAFGFMLEHGIQQPTQLCHVQYNAKHRCVGFETLCPSVGHIFYVYGLPAMVPVKLSVSVRTTSDGKTFYQLEAPSCGLIRRLLMSLPTTGDRVAMGLQ